MTLRLRWVTSPLASCLHAVAAIESNRAISDADWHRALAEPSRLWLDRLRESGIPIERFLQESVAATLESSSPDEMVTRAIATISSHSHAPSIAPQHTAQLVDGLNSLVAAIMNAFPNLERELVLRIGPLREHWEARGPGLLRWLLRSTHGRSLDDFTSVLLVHPLHDGDVQPLYGHRALLVEALLVNPEPRLPEIVRLAWGFSRLISYAAEDSATSSPESGAHLRRQGLVNAFGLLPAALDTAEQVEICQAGPKAVELAMRTWHLPDIVKPGELWTWWQSHCETSQGESSLTWATSLAKLDALIPALTD